MGYQTRLPELQTMKWTLVLSVTVATHSPPSLPITAASRVICRVRGTQQQVVKKEWKQRGLKDQNQWETKAPITMSFSGPVLKAPNRSVSKNHRAISSVTFLKHHSSVFKITKMLLRWGGAGFRMGRRRKLNVVNKRATARYMDLVTTTIEATQTYTHAKIP